MFLASISLALVICLGLAVLVMRPPVQDVIDLALVFGATGLSAALLGFLSHRSGWWMRASSLTQSMTIGHLLATLVGLLIVFLAARLMFINQHDLTLAGLLLLFASSVAVSFGYFLSNSISGRLRALDQGARRLSEGDFSTRVQISGQDEVAQLGKAFNQMAERLQRAEAESSRLEQARIDFIAGASHDLRTPLTSLRAMLDAIADGVAQEPDEYIRRSLKVIGQLTRLSDDLVELARLDSAEVPLEMSSSSLAEVVNSAVEGAAYSAQEKGVRLTTIGPLAADGSAGAVWMAEDSIARVLGNLLDNAIRHTQSGGEVQVELNESNGTVQVSVQDNGEGIPADQLPHIFDRFYRGERSRTEPGVGLGLAIAKQLVEAHGGTIWAESEAQRGTRITFTLPNPGEHAPDGAAGMARTE